MIRWFDNLIALCIYLCLLRNCVITCYWALHHITPHLSLSLSLPFFHPLLSLYICPRDICVKCVMCNLARLGWLSYRGRVQVRAIHQRFEARLARAGVSFLFFVSFVFFILVVDWKICERSLVKADPSQTHKLLPLFPRHSSLAS